MFTTFIHRSLGVLTLGASILLASCSSYQATSVTPSAYNKIQAIQTPVLADNKEQSLQYICATGETVITLLPNHTAGLQTPSGSHYQLLLDPHDRVTKNHRRYLTNNNYLQVVLNRGELTAVWYDNLQPNVVRHEMNCIIAAVSQPK